MSDRDELAQLISDVISSAPLIGGPLDGEQVPIIRDADGWPLRRIELAVNDPAEYVQTDEPPMTGQMRTVFYQADDHRRAYVYDD